VLKLLDWTKGTGTAAGALADKSPATGERRRESRSDMCGWKVIVRQRKALGILHLKNLSSNGGCGITDMPLEIGSLVFIELKKPHFYAAEVRWARNVSIGLEFFRPVKPAMLERLQQDRAAARAARE
jgi:hypothetical protein